MKEVQVYGAKMSPISKRVEIALRMKGVEYEYVEEDLQNKSEELVKYNPVYKKIPVLVHNGKALPESLLILEYIDETWKPNPLLPTDPFQRSQARFWAKFIDDKFLPELGNVLRSEEMDPKAKEELERLFQILEDEIISGNKCFEGSKMGYLELVGSLILYWLPVMQDVSGKELLTREQYPAMYAWAERLFATPGVKESLPDKQELARAIAFRLQAMRANAT